MTQLATEALRSSRRPLPEGWRWVRLGDVANYVNGRAFKPDEWATAGVPIIRIENLNSPEAPFNYLNGEPEPRHRVEDGDLLISWSASLDAYIWRRGPAVLNQHIFRVLEHSDLVTRGYLYWVARNAMSEIRAQVHGATMRHITKPEFEAIQIPLPPLEEQKRIAAILEEQMAAVERARAAAQAQLQSAKALPAAYLRAVFDSPEAQRWPRKLLAQVCDLESGCFLPREQVTFDGPVPVYGANGIIGYTTEPCFREPRIVLGRVGSCGAVNATSGPAWITDNTIVCNPRQEIDLAFLRAFLESANVGSLRSSSIQPLITQAAVRRLLVPVPLISDQRRTAAARAEQQGSAERLCDALETQLQVINRLPAAILRQAFIGAL